ncbi:fatty acid/phospholipid synthesis protein PlsX [Solidesulfovibrio fructosivorans JJ]]|uniref:Phosphate acyltransferase n=1 Tax=Solidesulfovibrio fructosivorans JJ] TaxID=596151 RepID=E1JSD6_SOLFR|nr:phosphate acyltransferase PlsX [Solidesulfovibrio fructosivorans]EFL52905.1 fatty acid/phospholipid synthesis protein PlsX [Solidesulfovibrio fructosivorans JJ]]
MPNNKPRIAVDAMGGDFGPHVVVPGALQAARTGKAEIILVGDTDAINAQLARYDVKGLPVSVVHASQVVEMEEKPSEALRRKRDSSIQVACNLVREGNADGVISAGHSGATLACAMFTIGRAPGVERPALATFMPTERSHTVIIDVGANVDCKPFHLLQFGVMASVLAQTMLGRENPAVALLSNGEESGKGNHLVKETFDLLRRSSLNFVGNIEGRDLFTGNVDVVVCDGFVGNVVVKQAEGLASSLGRLLKGELRRGFFGKIGTMLALNALKRFSRLVDYAEYGGAPLLGLKGICLICHGASNSKAMSSAVRMAARFVEMEANTHLSTAVAKNIDLAGLRRQAVNDQR